MAPKSKPQSAPSKQKQKSSFFQKRTTSVGSNPNATIIGKGVSIEGGTIKGEGSICINGYFVGDIDIKGDVEIGASGAVYGDIAASGAVISGNCKGSISTGSKILLTSTAVVEGSLNSKAIIIDEHAVFNGQCKMETHVQLPDAVKA